MKMKTPFLSLLSVAAFAQAVVVNPPAVTLNCLLFFLLAASAAFAQTVNVGGLTATPDATAALNLWIVNHPLISGQTTSGAIGIADPTITLPIAFLTPDATTGKIPCSESYGIVTLTSAANVSTASGVATVNVPTGTQVTISNSLTVAYNATFKTTSAPSTGAGLTWALTIADGNYANASPSTNGYSVLTYNRCTVLVDSEAIFLNGTSDGTNFAATRGALGTTTAAHAGGAPIVLLQYADMRAVDRSNAQLNRQAMLAQQPSPAVLAQRAIIDAANAKIAQLQKISGQ